MSSLQFVPFSYSLLTKDHYFGIHSIRSMSTPYGHNEFHIRGVIDYFNLKDSYDYVSSKLLYNSSEDILPMAVRYASPSKDFFIVERPPFQSPIDYSNNKSYRNRSYPKILNNKTVWVPWTVSIIYLSPTSYSFYLFFNDSPLTSFDDKLIPCWLPNSRMGDVCMGADSSVVINMVRSDKNLIDIYNYLFNSYFVGWNSDIVNEPYDFIKFCKLNGITDRIATTPKVPKSVLSFLDRAYYSGNQKDALYVLSQMSLEETLSLVSHTKNNSVHSSYSNTLRSTAQNILTRVHGSSQEITPQHYFENGLQNNLNINQSYPMSVVISGFDPDYAPYYHIDPYIVSSIYSDFINGISSYSGDPIKFNNTFSGLNRSYITSLSYSHSIIKDYLSPIDQLKEIYNGKFPSHVV